VIAGAAAIAGIGATEFSKDSGRSELRLAVEAVRAALDDAGLQPSDVDGLVTFTMDDNAEIAVAREIGAGELTFLSRIGYGGGAACAVVQQAVLAVATGVARTVVCYRALNERSGRRFGQATMAPGLDASWHYPMGLATPAAMVAMVARRYLHDYGATTEDFGRVTVMARRFAATNPAAWFFGRPITLADHQASRWIAEPLRLLDCCQESDGAVALVVTSADRARDLRRPPVFIRGMGQGHPGGDPSETLTSGAAIAKDVAFPMAGIGLEDVDVVELYDCYTFTVLVCLEDYGFCKKGEGGAFVADGRIAPGGSLPVNTGGGQLSSFYMWGMTPVSEAVIQIRGEGGERQVPDAEVALVSGNGGILSTHSTLILTRS